MPYQNRYFIATFVACLIVALGLGGMWYVGRLATAAARDQLKAAAQAGKLPDSMKGVDLDTVPLTDFNVELPDWMILLVNIADLLRDLWFVWIPLVFVVCLGAAWFLK
jgi:hypothetical protein